MTDGCAALGCRDEPEVRIALTDDRERPVCSRCAKQEVREQDAEVIGDV